MKSRFIFKAAFIAAVVALPLGLPNATAQTAIPERPEKLSFPPLVYEPPNPADFRVALKAGPIAYVVPDRELPLINIVDAIGAELRKRQLRRVALFGTTFTMQGSLWGQLSGVEIVKPQPDEIAFVGRAYQRILDTQRGHDEDTTGLRRIATDLQQRDGVEAILLAGTDLAVIFDEETAGFPCIDCARVHIDAIVERLAAGER